ncbi:hypothetical protein KIPB_003070 [Kipferlia bialata]|uniref:Tc1-like transposase DDE domain-containing protein n=1 Tax=Kipferlia bialata TaxID=797122 RepID=A0A9K3CSD3_9EUKA|nr:hypothetical protein KIPB_003070 [Kipferlia bialata]|eukprot:g3070.t1
MTAVHAKFKEHHRLFLVSLARNDPMGYLDEFGARFRLEFNMSISDTSVSRILHLHGLSRKVVSTIAARQRVATIIEYSAQINSLRPSHDMLVFCDESSCDVRDLLRRYGWEDKGKDLIMRVPMDRNGRISVMAFIGHTGVLDYNYVTGTYDSVAFVNTVFALFRKGYLNPYPLPRSVLIMDGAHIHTAKGVIDKIESLGIKVIVLSPYSPQQV